jgi:hypothetical protein
MAQFKFIDCPNCQGKGHGYGDGGFESVSPLVQVVPNCRICDAHGKLVICYQCNKITTYHHDDIMDKTSDRICDGCDARLVKPPPPKCTVHGNLVQQPNGIIKCATCQTVFAEKPVEPTIESNPQNNSGKPLSNKSSSKRWKKECG